MSAVFGSLQSEQNGPSSMEIICPRCEGCLTLHQPDPDLPNRLLATCDECKSWFLAEPDAGALTRLARFGKNRIRGRRDRDPGVD
jgi:hypothetical protein